MSKKMKRFTMSIAVMTSAVPTTAPVVSSLSSCSKKTFKMPSYDKEYGITRRSYENMKNRFRSLYKNEMEHNRGYTGDALIEKMKNFDATLVRFDNSTYSEPKTNRYATATFALSHFAKVTYGFDLERDQCLTKKITWSNINQMFQGVKNSWDIYLKNNHMSDEERNAIMQHAQDEYDQLSDSLRNKYPNDTLTAYTMAQASLVKCFEEVNEQIGLLAAQARLGDFMSTYSISYKSEDRETNGYDAIQTELNNSIGKTISSTLMNKLFTFTNVTDGTVTTFSNDIIPGHILSPVLMAIKHNKYSNVFSLDVDWQIYKYKRGDSPEQIKRKTAHLYLGPSKDKFDDEGTLISKDETVNDLLSDAVVAPTKYGIQSTTEFAKASVVDTYFNPQSEDGYISGIHWSKDTSKPNPWEALFTKKVLSHSVYHLKREDLSNSGIELETTQPDGSKILYSLKGLIENTDPSKPDEELTLAQKFVKYCALEADVRILHDETGLHEAGATFYVAYPGERLEVLSGYDIDSETNFAISEHLYADVNMKFNDAYDALDTYKNKGIKDLKNAVTDNVIQATVGFLFEQLMTILFMASVVRPDPILDCQPAEKAKNIAVCAMQGTQTIIANIQLFATIFVSAPVWVFDDGMDNMKADLNKNDADWWKNLCQKFDDDHKNYFVLWQTDKNPDEAFKTKSKTFRDLPWMPSKQEQTSASALKDYYENFINSEDYKRICDAAKKYEVTPEDFRKLEARQDKYFNTVSNCSFYFGLIASAVINRVIQKIGDRKVMALVREKQMVDIEKKQKLVHSINERQIYAETMCHKILEAEDYYRKLWQSAGPHTIEEWHAFDRMLEERYSALWRTCCSILDELRFEIKDLAPWLPG